MASKVKDKLQLVQRDEVRYREIIKKFKKTLCLWFMFGTVDNNILKELVNSCVDIILHGLKTGTKKLQTKEGIHPLFYDSTKSLSSNGQNNVFCSGDIKLNELPKIIEDFEWIRNAVSVRRNANNTPPPCALFTEEVSQGKRISTIQIQKLSLTSHVAKWLKHNLTEPNLCGFLQYLVNDKELLEEHYYEEALLRQDKYVTILVMGLTAYETQQYALVRQIESALEDDINESKQKRRTNSQPNISVVLSKTYNFPIVKQHISVTSTPQRYSDFFSTNIRRTQSLPAFIDKKIVYGYIDEIFSKRPNCETVGTVEYIRSSPQNIPGKIKQPSNCIISQNYLHMTTLSSTIISDNQPTTSQANSNRSKSSLSNCTFFNSNSATSSLTSTSVPSLNSNNKAEGIQLINTDNIKIWTDHSWELKQKNKHKKQLDPTASCAIPTPLNPSAKTLKSRSPLNSFFSSLFSTPPSYTSWFIDQGTQHEYNTTETAIESIIPESNNIENRNTMLLSSQQQSLTSTVFDNFLPIDGKKVQGRKSKNLFDDIKTTIDCSGISKPMPADNISSDLSYSSLSAVIPKNCQSLTKFLQMSHMSRNNTDLEKENAHFRISEAIISAIEHIKWNKLEKQRNKSCHEATSLATDCLASQSTPAVTTSNDSEVEHMPYAELEEESYDILSAEVVGLSLISKFDEKQLPKVSELKWLVSDDDTPQNLLPMPDLSSSANPDENIIQPTIRGTRYWAPPRRQIIFSDHPSTNRKDLLKRQNYRCAGCGMRVSRQYMQSFRYCTYLGKYHCTGCHRNQISVTPAKILQSWDFKCYPVSVFAYRLLEEMYTYPLFYVPNLNPALYGRCKSLLTARNKRLQLKYIKDFVCMCRFALLEESYFSSIPDYITADIDNWSMRDFIDTRTKCLHRSIDELTKKCEKHIFNCVLCTGRGFLCEYCRVNIVIFPWLSRVHRCDCCGTCFHRSCWKSMNEKCCRCQRIDKRHDEINDTI